MKGTWQYLYAQFECCTRAMMVGRAGPVVEMNEQEVEAVAELLAKVGSSYYPERTRPTLRTINNKHREIAQLVLAALEKVRGAQRKASDDARSDGGASFNFADADLLYVGATVVYRPPGEKRAVTCLIEKMERGRAYLVPASQEIGWVPTHTLSPRKP